MAKDLPVSDDVSVEAVTAIVDVLLLSIVQAYPSDKIDQTDNKRVKADNYGRLNAAKKALFGVDSPKGRPTDDDTPEMLHMTEAYIRERGEPTHGENYNLQWPGGGDQSLASETALARHAMDARKAADTNYRPFNEEEKVRNLQQKFHRNISAWLTMSYNQPGTAESVFQWKLEELAELLQPIGLRIQIPSNLLRQVKGPI